MLWSLTLHAKFASVLSKVVLIILIMSSIATLLVLCLHYHHASSDMNYAVLIPYGRFAGSTGCKSTRE